MSVIRSKQVSARWRYYSIGNNSGLRTLVCIVEVFHNRGSLFSEVPLY